MTAKKSQQKTCFVIGPIGPAASPTRTHADWLLEGIIEPVFTTNYPEFLVTRSDKIAEPGMIDSQIINILLDCELVIADMSLLNVNAFYEMGIRHMAQKPIIHMFLEGSEIPFDVKPYRAIPFSVSHPRDLTTARSALYDAVKEVLKPEHAVDNPVTRARGKVQFAAKATEPELLLASEVQDLKERLSNIESNPRAMAAVRQNVLSNYAADISRQNTLTFTLKKSLNLSASQSIFEDIKSIMSTGGLSSITGTMSNDYLHIDFIGEVDDTTQERIVDFMANCDHVISSAYRRPRKSR